MTHDTHRQLTDVLGPLEGGDTLGGCDHCEAYQRPEPIAAGVWRITVHHDDWCPWLAEREQRGE